MANVPLSTNSLPLKRILVVDDDPSIRLLCTRSLNLAGYDVLEAAGSSEAMALYAAATEPIDLLLIDLFLPPPDFQLNSAGTQYPRVNGHQLLCQVLSLKRQVRALFVSSHPYAGLASQGMAIRREQFLEKPFSVETLLAQVTAALAAPPIPHSTIGDMASLEEVQWVD
jgi:DNA-binding response OmpR family regulator